MRFLFVAMGSGEVAQGAALADYVSKRGHRVTFISLLEENLPILSGLELKKVVQSDPRAIRRTIESGNFNVVVLCNSKIFRENREFQTTIPANKPFTISIDSNWLFDQSERYPCVQWIDRFFVNIPAGVFKLGLKENGGHYLIPDEVKSKIRAIGLVPSYQPISIAQRERIRRRLGLDSNQKLIFGYIGKGVNFREGLYPEFIKIFDYVHKKYQGKVKIAFRCDEEIRRPWLVKIPSKMSNADFFNLLSAADLNFQHHGLGTLEQAIAAQVPSIVNIAVPKKGEKVHCHEWELKPFEQRGLCRINYYDTPPEQVSMLIWRLLYSGDQFQIKEAQRRAYSNGEEEIYKEIIGGRSKWRQNILKLGLRLRKLKVY